MEHTVWSAILSQALGIEVGHFEEIFAPINPSYEAFFSFQTKLTTLTITGFMQIYTVMM